jgi:hypothetical protein
MSVKNLNARLSENGQHYCNFGKEKAAAAAARQKIEFGGSSIVMNSSINLPYDRLSHHGIIMTAL